MWEPWAQPQPAPASFDDVQQPDKQAADVYYVQPADMTPFESFGYYEGDAALYPDALACDLLAPKPPPPAADNGIDYEQVRRIKGYLQNSVRRKFPDAVEDADKLYDASCDELISDILGEFAPATPTTEAFYPYPEAEALPPLLVEESAWPQDALVFPFDDGESEKQPTYEEFVPQQLDGACLQVVEPVGPTPSVTIHHRPEEESTETPVEPPPPTPTSSDSEYSESSDGLSDSDEVERPKRRQRRTKRALAVTARSQVLQVLADMETASRTCAAAVELRLRAPRLAYRVDAPGAVYSCRRCGHSYGSVRELFAHHERAHAVAAVDVREVELRARGARETVHFVVAPLAKRFECKKCARAYSDAVALYRHVGTHVADTQFPCPTCGKAFRFQRYLALHRRTHDAARAFPCARCPKVFRAKDTLRTHELVHHGAARQAFACRTCGKSFPVEQYLRLHERRHARETGRVCHVCGKVLKNEAQCQQHVRDKHPEPTAPSTPPPPPARKECPECGKTFPAQRNLRAHLKLHGAKEFRCGECGKEFAVRRALADHERLHSGEKPHACPTCPKRFRLPGALYKHVRTHTGDKPFACPTCPKRFAQLTTLHVHQRSHSGDKPHACPTCHKRYAQAYVCQQHIKKHHPEVHAAKVKT